MWNVGRPRDEVFGSDCSGTCSNGTRCDCAACRGKDSGDCACNGQASRGCGGSPGPESRSGASASQGGVGGSLAEPGMSATNGGFADWRIPDTTAIPGITTIQWDPWTTTGGGGSGGRPLKGPWLDAMARPRVPNGHASLEAVVRTSQTLWRSAGAVVGPLSTWSWRSALVGEMIMSAQLPPGSPSTHDIRHAQAVIRRVMAVWEDDFGMAYNAAVSYVIAMVGAEAGPWCWEQRVVGLPIPNCLPGPMCLAKISIEDHIVADCIRDTWLEATVLSCICKVVDLDDIPWWAWLMLGVGGIITALSGGPIAGGMVGVAAYQGVMGAHGAYAGHDR